MASNLISSASLIVEDVGSVRKLIINRPAKANAINAAILDLIEKAIGEARMNSDIRLLTILGAGDRCFSAGADLEEAESQTRNAELAQAYDRRWDQLTAAIQSLPCITIACVNGPCIGGGLSLALACDFRICSETASFWYPAAKHGFIPTQADATRLKSLIGVSRTKAVLLLGNKISAEEALSIGLVDTIVDGASINAAIETLKVAIETGTFISQAITKSILDWPSTDERLRDCYRAAYDRDQSALRRLFASS